VLRGLATAVAVLCLCSSGGVTAAAQVRPTSAPVGVPSPAPGATPAVDPGHPGAGTAPELSDVKVTSGAVTQARSKLDGAKAAVQQSLRDKADLVATLDDLARQRDATVSDLASANQGVVSAQADLTVAQQRHTDALADLGRAEDAVAAARRRVREVAMAAYVSGGDPSQILTLSRPQHFLDGERRHAMSHASVPARNRDLLVRVHARQLAMQAVQAAEAGVQKATDALGRAVTHRDQTHKHLEDLVGRLAKTTERSRQADITIVKRFAAQGDAALAVADARVLAPVDGADFPLVALDAYWKAAKRAPCRIEWWALAGITYIESKHGTDEGSRLDAGGETSKRIVGIPLDGAKGSAVIRDTDGGALDGDPVWDHAVGPMQFIPSTWKAWAADGNGDGKADPSNLYDAAAVAAKYLCAGRTDLSTDASLRSGYLSYNQSDFYATVVLNRARQYQRSVPIRPSPHPA